MWDEYFAGKVYNFDLITDSILNGKMVLDLEPYVVFRKGMDAARKDNSNFHKDPIFQRLNSKVANSDFTLREVIYMIRERMKNSSGGDQLEKRMIMALLSGRKTSSIKTITKDFKSIQQAHSELTLELWR